MVVEGPYFFVPTTKGVYHMPEEQSTFDSWNPAQVFEFLSDHPELHTKSFWLHEKQRPLLMTLRTDEKIWAATCVLARQAWLSKKELEAYLNVYLELEGMPIPTASIPTPDPPLLGEIGSLRGLQYSDKKKLKETIGNWMLLLEHSPQIRELLRFNTFRHCVQRGNRILDENDETLLASELSLAYQFPFTRPGNFHRACLAVAAKHSYDELEEWLQSLKWDGIPRLNDWLIQCGQVEPTVLNIWIGRTLILQMVERGLVPGCIARYVPIFVGREDEGKTEAVLCLGQPWAATFDMGLETKEAQLAIQGLWLAELGELDTIYRSRESRMKSFLSARQDHVVRKYSNLPSTYLRRTTFIGTTNDQNFLPMANENTRFFPVSTGHWDIAALERMREQLFAEAVMILKALPQWWRIPEEIQSALGQRRLEYQQTSAWEEPLAQWLALRGSEPFHLHEALEQGLDIMDKSKWGKAKEMELGAVLRKLGCQRKQLWIQGKNKKMWAYIHLP